MICDHFPGESAASASSQDCSAFALSELCALIEALLRCGGCLGQDTLTKIQAKTFRVFTDFFFTNVDIGWDGLGSKMTGTIFFFTGGFLKWEATPSHHPFTDVFPCFSMINHPAMGVPPMTMETTIFYHILTWDWIEKYRQKSKEDCLRSPSRKKTEYSC